MNRLIGIITSGVVALAGRKGAHLDADTVAWIMLATYSGVHTAIDFLRGKRASK
jgi:hypothetical protein